MIWVTDVKGGKVAINERHIVAVFKILEGEYAGKTGIGLSNAQVIVEEEDFVIVGQMANNYD